MIHNDSSVRFPVIQYSHSWTILKIQKTLTHTPEPKTLLHTHPAVDRCYLVPRVLQKCAKDFCSGGQKSATHCLKIILKNYENQVQATRQRLSGLAGSPPGADAASRRAVDTVGCGDWEPHILRC